MTYNALSYVWGDPSEMRQIICDGMACMITVNLFHALARIRSSRADVLLWADVLCIDQENQSEKTRQVRVMGDIYGQAQMVLIWLGSEQEHDRESYAIACRLYDLLGDVGSEGALAESDKTLDLGKAGLPDEPNDIRWAHIAQLCNKEWFSRIWIVQEFLVAQSSIFLCGELEMDPEVILNVSTTLLLSHQFGTALNHALVIDPSTIADGPFGGACLRYLRQNRNTEDGLQLLQLLTVTNAFRFTDPRDRIFALIGLQHDIPLEDIDYSLEISVLELRITLAILSRVWLPTNVLARTAGLVPRPGMPSWLPAWGNQRRKVMRYGVAPSQLEDIDYGEPDFWVEDQKVRNLSLCQIDRKNVPKLVAITRSHDV